jgi:hypothetical protein
MAWAPGAVELKANRPVVAQGGEPGCGPEVEKYTTELLTVTWTTCPEELPPLAADATADKRATAPASHNFFAIAIAPILPGLVG